MKEEKRERRGSRAAEKHAEERMRKAGREKEENVKGWKCETG